jgi:hypothetical protein
LYLTKNVKKKIEKMLRINVLKRLKFVLFICIETENIKKLTSSKISIKSHDHQPPQPTSWYDQYAPVYKADAVIAT